MFARRLEKKPRRMNLYQGLRQFVLGAPLDPLSTKTRHSIALVAFFAWVGLGADGISSSGLRPGGGVPRARQATTSSACTWRSPRG